ncbi:MAG: KpsF/GutQ family sugar-phosphate isomerase [Burkholderiales bacterium]|nr:KpsF/GutQ family sugar-phosphate isomerase [Burkholderiales bacterium]
MNFDKKSILQKAHQVATDEIDGLKQVFDNLGDDFLATLNAIINCNGKIVLTGIGKSGHIARKIAATLASTGTPAFFIHPAEALHGDLGMVSDNDLIIAISYSGEAQELSDILTLLKRRHLTIIGITGNISTSSLAKLSDYSLSINVKEEACPLNLAPTTSTTATLVLGDAIAICLMHIRGFKPQDFALSHPGGSLGRKLLTCNKDIMRTDNEIPLVSPQSSLKDVVLEISKKALGFTIVAKNNQVIGVITDGDLRRRLVNDEINLTKIKAIDLMTANPKLVQAEDLAVKSVELMEQYKITGFIVVDIFGTIVGAFNLHDLFKAKLL